MCSKGCPPKFISILKAFHNRMFARVKVGGLLSDPFEVKVGVKQGCVLAPILSVSYTHLTLPTIYSV